MSPTSQNRPPAFPSFHPILGSLAWAAGGNIINTVQWISNVRLVGSASAAVDFDHTFNLTLPGDFTFFCNRVVAVCQPDPDDAGLRWEDYAFFTMMLSEGTESLNLHGGRWLSADTVTGRPASITDTSMTVPYAPLTAHTMERATYREAPMILRSNINYKLQWRLNKGFPSANHSVTDEPGRRADLGFEGYLVRTDLANRLLEQRRAMYATVT